MEFQRLEKKIEGRVLVATFNRPAQLNALDTRALDEIDAVIAEAEANENIAVVVFTGTGKAFVAGADISQMVNMSGAQATEFSKHGQKVFDRIENLGKPVIAAINGYALGGGCELAMACDIRYASELAKLGQPEVNLGVIPGFAGTQRLPRLVGSGVAMELLLTGNVITAEEAHKIGLVDKVVPAEGLTEEVMNLASVISLKCDGAVAFNKKALRAGLPKYDEETEARLFGECFDKGDAKTGMSAFIDKVSPKWR